MRECKKVEWGQCSSFVPVQEVLGRSQVILPRAALYHRGKKSVPIDYKPHNLFILSYYTINILLLQLQTETMGLFVLVIITILEYKRWSMREGEKIAAVGPYDLISLWGFK